MKKDIPQVEYKPPQCPSCNSTERGKIEGVHTLDYSGVDADGQSYLCIKWGYITCRCGQRYAIRWKER